MHNLKKKILQGAESLAQLEALGSGHKKIGLTYGHFNVVHPGHTRFLHYAKEQCDLLVVAVLGLEHLEEQQKAKFFPCKDRVLAVAAMQFVDHVVDMSGTQLEEIISKLRPKVFVLGKEFEEERHQGIQNYLDLVSLHGGHTLFSSGEVSYASSETLFSNPDEIHAERLQEFYQACKRTGVDLLTLKRKLADFGKTNVAVLGDTIVDQFIACDAQGMSQEAPVLVIRELHSKEFLGGAGIIACHLKSLGANCHFLSVVGNDENAKVVESFLKKYQVPHSLYRDETRQTTFKMRYMVENQKLLRVSRLQEHGISKDLEREILNRLEEMAPQLDGIIVADFVYGVITDSLLKGVQALAKQYNLWLFGDLQCSSQVGNVTKFQDFYLITPTERETRIALADSESGLETLARKLLSKTQAQNLLITLGRSGFIAYINQGQGQHVNQHFPALCQNAVDVAGAGDTLLSVLAAGLCSGMEMMEAAALGACAAAVAVGRIGNIPLKPAELSAYLENLIMQVDRQIESN